MLFSHAAQEIVNVVMIVALAVQTVMPLFVAVLKSDWFQKAAMMKLTYQVQNTLQNIHLLQYLNQTITTQENRNIQQQNLVY